MRLNKQDGGSRQCISITNNEVSADEQKALRERGLRPGDPEWEALGICDHITKPRVQAAITGKTPEGDPIKGDYKFTDEFPMADGFEENAEFFTLTYETPVGVSYQTAFSRIAPLLWLRAGSVGRRIDKLPAAGGRGGLHGLLVDLDTATDFLKAARAKSIRVVFIVTDDERRFKPVAAAAGGRETVRLYESYLTNFAFANGDGMKFTLHGYQNDAVRSVGQPEEGPPALAPRQRSSCLLADGGDRSGQNCHGRCGVRGAVPRR